MTKQEILDTFKDIDFVYNNSSKHEILSQMLDELLQEQNNCKNCAIAIEDRQPIVRCKDCKHRPKEPNWKTYKNGFDIEFPEGSKCPCQCSDEYYSWYPKDDWFCANGDML